MALDVAPALHVNVEDDVLAALRLCFHLCFKCAIEAVLIDLLVFQKLVAFYLGPESLGCEEEILHAVALRATRLATGATDGESQSQFGVLVLYSYQV